MCFTSEAGGKNETLRFLDGMKLGSTGDASSSNFVALHNSLALLDVVRFLSFWFRESTISRCFAPPSFPAPFTIMEDFRGAIFLVGSSTISIVFGTSSSSSSSSDEIEMSRPGSLRILVMRISIKIS